ncbi:MAG: hypothetical protein LBI13_02715 [Streptococcaceae bacterium]|jgi:hypothetical protein|nr:hypothetical protein [Streptococcaceae bacterium]
MKDIHDSEILEVRTKLKEREVELLLKSDTNEDFKVVFKDVFSFLIENPLTTSIVLEINEFPTEKFYITDDKLRTVDKQLMVHARFIDSDSYNRAIKDYKSYIISSSLGLNGWIIAKEMKVI